MSALNLFYITFWCINTIGDISTHNSVYLLYYYVLCLIIGVFVCDFSFSSSFACFASLRSLLNSILSSSTLNSLYALYLSSAIFFFLYFLSCYYCFLRCIDFSLGSIIFWCFLCLWNYVLSRLLNFCRAFYFC